MKEKGKPGETKILQPGEEVQTLSIPGLNIFQRLNKVREQVAYLQKDKKVEGYMAVTHDWVTANVRPLFIQFGIMMVPMELASKIEETGKQTSKGTPITRYVVRYQFDFVNIDKPEDRITTVISAIGEDTSDKGPGKAISYAAKYAMLKILNIETGESEESRLADVTPVYATEEQRDMIMGLLMEYGLEKNKGYIASLQKFLRIGRWEELKVNDVKKAADAIHKAGKSLDNTKGGKDEKGQQSLL